MMYAVEAWYPSQFVLQNSIERVKKFAAKLVANDFKSPYPVLLEKLNWKSVSQMVMEKRAVAVHNYVQGYGMYKATEIYQITRLCKEVQ
jgi:hypothetical protein